jgi:hypothetical protein
MAANVVKTPDKQAIYLKLFGRFKARFSFFQLFIILVLIINIGAVKHIGEFHIFV